MIDDFYEPTLSDYAAALWRRWWILGIGALVGVVLLQIAPIGGAGSYTSSITIDVDDSRALAETLQLGLVPNRQASATAEANRAVSEATRNAFEAEQGHSISVSSSPDEPNGQFTLTVSADSAAEATEDAAAFAELALARRDAQRAAELSDAIAVTTAQLAEQTAERDRLAAELSAAGGAASESLTIQSTAAAEAVVRLQQRLTGLQELASLAGSSLGIAGAATDATQDAGWGTTTRVGLGLVLGLVAGATVVIVMTATDRHLRRRRDVELVAGTTPVLGVIDRGGDAGLVASTATTLRQRAGAATVQVLAVNDPADATEAARLLGAGSGVELHAAGTVQADAAGLAGQGTEVLVVANARRSTDAALNAALTLLDDLGIAVCGIVLVDVDRRDLPGAAASVVVEAVAPLEAVGSAPRQLP